MVPYRAEYNKFCLDSGDHYFGLTDIHIIVLKDNAGVSIKYILGILNSRLINYFYKFIGRRKGKMFEYFVEPLSKIPIRIVLEKDQKSLTVIVDQILSITKLDNYFQDIQKQAKVKALETEIDQFVYKLYNLTPEEIKIVEGKHENAD